MLQCCINFGIYQSLLWWAICSKIKARVLQTFLRQNCIFSLISKMALAKMHIELNTQFCPKNVTRTSVFIYERPAIFYMSFVQK